MRKISILNEDFMALEQKIAEAIDNAEVTVESAMAEMEEELKDLLSKVEDKANFHKDANFIVWKNEFKVDGMIKDLDRSLADMAVKMKNSDSLSMELTAHLSKVAEAMGQQADHEDDVSELVYFFGGKENTNIPDSENNEFVVVLSDAAKKEAIQKMISLRSHFEELREIVMKALEGGQILPQFEEAMQHLAVMKDLAEHFLSKDLKQEEESLEEAADSALMKQSQLANGWSMSKQGRYDEEMLTAKALDAIKSTLGMTLLGLIPLAGLPFAIAAGVRQNNNLERINSESYKELRDFVKKDPEAQKIIKKIKLELMESRPSTKVLEGLKKEFFAAIRAAKEKYKEEALQEAFLFFEKRYNII